MGPHQDEAVGAVGAEIEAVLERVVGEETTTEERAELAGIVGQTVELALRRLGWRP